MKRPVFEDIKSGLEFNQWYWLKEEMVEICRQLSLPVTGRKFQLRDRIMYALDNNGEVKFEAEKTKAKSSFNWAKSELTLKTIITDNISFGPNFRGFMKSQIGNKFSCHSDFMDWVKSNEGKNLQDAIRQWHILENRKKDPSFKRKISDSNMLAQYIRDFLENNKNSTLKDAKNYWKLKKQFPTKNGFVFYESSDLMLK